MYKDIPQDANLVEVYKTYTNQLYERIQQALNGANSIFLDVDTKLDLTIPKLKNDDKLLNRTVYLWTIKLTSQIQSNLDALVDIFNGYSLIDFKTGMPTGHLTLWSPHRLTIDDVYLTKLNNNYKSANELLDRLFSYLQPYAIKEG